MVFQGHISTLLSPAPLPGPAAVLKLLHLTGQRLTGMVKDDITPKRQEISMVFHEYSQDYDYYFDYHFAIF